MDEEITFDTKVGRFERITHITVKNGEAHTTLSWDFEKFQWYVQDSLIFGMFICISCPWLFAWALGYRWYPDWMLEIAIVGAALYFFKWATLLIAKAVDHFRKRLDE